MSKSALLSAEMEKSANLDALLVAMRGGNAAKFMELERIRARSISLPWYLGVIFALVSAVGCYDKERYILAALSFMAFLCFWRALYVENNSRHTVVSVLICAVVVVMNQ